MDFTKDIYINKDIILEDSEIVILYKGFLFSNNLTSELYISYGYGDLWDNKTEIKMKPSTFGYLATVKIGSGKNLQFCFRNNQGTWDNNNGGNYILPIEENESVLSFTPISETTKEITLELSSKNPIEENETIQNIFTPEIISSTPVELYQTVDLENIAKQTIPNNTVFTQVKLHENEQKHTFAKSVIQSVVPDESIYEEFAKITEKAKTNSVNAFDENKVTAGSIYVNSIVKEIPEAEEETSLIEQKEHSLSERISFIGSLFKNVKTAFSKLTTLIKATFNIGNEDN